jgi:hypothetical protein
VFQLDNYANNNVKEFRIEPALIDSRPKRLFYGDEREGKADPKICRQDAQPFHYRHQGP